MTRTTVYLAQWQNTWGEYHGVAGVFSTEDAAWDALREVEPRSDHAVTPIVLDEVRDAWDATFTERAVTS